MTAPTPACRVVEDAPNPAAARHPLATQSGVNALLHIIAADQHWRPMTPAGKRALRRAYNRALAEAVADGLDRVPLPALGDVHPATARALVRRGLAADGRLTPLAVEVCAWALLGEDRPVRDAHPTGDRL